jgi:hypothetical protein
MNKCEIVDTLKADLIAINAALSSGDASRDYILIDGGCGFGLPRRKLSDSSTVVPCQWEKATRFTESDASRLAVETNTTAILLGAYLQHLKVEIEDLIEVLS